MHAGGLRFISFIEILGFKVTHPICITSGENDNISRDLLVVPLQNDISHFELLPEGAFPVSGTGYVAGPVNYAGGG